jgi:hypothetical protein
MHARHRRIASTAVLSTLVAAFLVACGNGAPGDSNRSCVGPYLDDQPPGGGYGAPAPTTRPGGTLMIYGHWYTSTCNDTGGSDPLTPLAPVHLTVTLPGGRAVPLGEHTPHGPDMGFTAEVHIPTEAGAGIATIRDDRSYPEVYRFKILATK